LFLVKTRPQCDGAIFTNAVGGVLYQVDQNLFHLLGVNLNLRRRAFHLPTRT
jgi:hypothetical protein